MVTKAILILYYLHSLSSVYYTASMFALMDVVTWDICYNTQEDKLVRFL